MFNIRLNETDLGDTAVIRIIVYRPALGPTQPPAQRVPGVLSPGVKHGRDVNLTTHHHLVMRS
jgi:hypothetical protein